MSAFESQFFTVESGTSATVGTAYQRRSAHGRLGGFVDLLSDGVRGVALCAALGTSTTALSAAQGDASILLPQSSTHAALGRMTVEGPEQDLATIRELSDLTWAQIAQVFDVDRRSVHLWADGAGITARNTQNLSKVADRLRKLSREAGRNAGTLRNRLLRPLADGKCGLDRLLDDAGGVRAERTRSVLRKPAASAIAQVQAARKHRPKLLDYLNSSYDAIPGKDGRRSAGSFKEKPKR